MNRNLTYFVQECPTCGRALQVRVEYLGKRVACQHCSGRFVAADPAQSAPPVAPSQADLDQRIRELLEQARSAAGGSSQCSQAAYSSLTASE